ncbi:hemicentin-1-like [Haliotis asinina]|uniref:hemicentin-1-like n=1 Tax=Haliotis asinina TaxID=109174 RepID=UPI003531BB7E
MTLDIASPDSTRDSGTWTCSAGVSVSNSITLSQFAAVLEWSSVTFSPQLTSLPSSVTPQNTISVTVTSPCSAPATVITWRYQQGVSGVPPSSTSSTQGPCPSGQVQTTNILSLPGNTVSLYNRQVSLTVSVEHDSFDPPTYTNSATSNTIQFPVPVISVTLTNISSDNEKIGLATGLSLTLTCVTSSSFPTSAVTWATLPPGTTPTVSTETTSGVLVATRSSVTFTVSRSDLGRSVRCQAENINGQTSLLSNRTILEVWYGPDTDQVNLTKPTSTIATEDRDLTLTCETLTSVSPGVTFTWDYTDGTHITGGSTGSVTGSAGTPWSQTRTFRPVRNKPDVRCSVRNTRTAVVVNKTLSLRDIKYPPPGRPTVLDFTSVMYAGVENTIRCTVTGGNPLADITWSCYNTSTESSSGETKTSSLTFLVTKHQNTEQCLCQATWMYGGYDEAVTQTFTVYYPPDKPSITNPGTLCQGKSTSLTCSSSPDHGNPPATFYWTKNNIAVHTGSSYTLSPEKADNGADIRCAAGNNYTDRAGSSRPQSDARQLNVYYVGVPSVSPAATQTRKEGESLSLTCSVDGNPDNVDISWTFNGSPIPGSSVVKANLNRSDEGEYSCTGRVNTGSVCPDGGLQARSTVKVIVNYHSSIRIMTGNSRSGSVTVNESDPVTFRCELDNAGNPRSVIRLMNGSQELTRTDNSLTAIYILQSANCRQRGNYSCFSSNKIGAPVTERVELLVKCPPRVAETVSLPLKFATRLGGDVTVSVSVFAYPLPTFIWSRSISTTQDLTGTSIPVSDISVTARLHLTNLEQQDFGDYDLAVSNGVGEPVTYTVTLVPAGPPQTPTQFRDLDNATTSSIWLSWLPGFNGGCTQTFLIEYRQFATRRWTAYKSYDDRGEIMVVEVTGLTPGEIYPFRLQARNDYGSSNRHVFVETATAGDPPDQQNLDASCSGIIAGVTVGTFLLTLLFGGTILIILYRKGCVFGNSLKGASPKSSSHPEPVEMDNREYSSLDQISAPAQYSNVEEESERQQYTQLKIYENIKVSAQNYHLTSSCGGSVQAGGSCTLMCYTGEASHTAMVWQNGTLVYRVNQGSCSSTSIRLPADYTTSCPSSTNYTLTIANAMYGRDKLRWRCDFQFGSRASNQIQINIFVPLSNVTLTRSTTSITCVAVSNPPPSMTLYKDGTSVATSPAAVEGYTGWTATINYQLTGNSRNSLYYCQASNTQSTVNSTYSFPDIAVKSVSLTNITSANQEVGVAESQPLALTCVTSASYPAATISWYKNSVLLPSRISIGHTSQSGVVQTTSTVTFYPVRGDLGHTIYCRATNIHNPAPVESGRARIGVWFGPEQVDVTKPINSVAVENRNITLTCTASAYPNVTFTWHYSDGTATGGHIGPVTGSSTWWYQTLTFRPNKEKTTVRCQVRNTRTSTTKTGSVSLDVKYPPPLPPSITQFPALMFEGEQQTISCSVTGGNPLPTITWSCPDTGSASVSDSGQTRTSTLSFTVSRSQHSQQCECLGAWRYGGYNYTDVRTFNISCPSSTQPPKEEYNRTSIIAGTAIGTLLLTLLIEGLVLTVLYRKGFRFGKILKGSATPKSTRNPETEEMENTAYSSLDHINSPAESNMDTERQHYTQLKVYENTNVEAKAETSAYEDVIETPSVPYESIRASP